MNHTYSRKQQIFGLVICLGLILTMSWLLINIRNYVSVEAVIKNVKIEMHRNSKNEIVRRKYEYLEYEYEGKTLNEKRWAPFSSDRNIGKTVIIRCDPNLPDILESPGETLAEGAILGLSIIGAAVIVWNLRKDSGEQISSH